MKLKKLIAIEVGVALVVLIVILFLVEFTPYLVSSKPNSSIGVYNEKEFAENSVFLVRGQSTVAQFNYSSFDPAIVVVDLSFQSFQTPGDLVVVCNGRRVSSVFPSSSSPQVRLNVITFSGSDWVETASSSSANSVNEISFVSNRQSGFEGNFSYQISIRGSR